MDDMIAVAGAPVIHLIALLEEGLPQILTSMA
jgi:hypothetical protein